MIGIDNLIKNAWQIQKKNLWTYAGIVILPLIVAFIVGIITGLTSIGGILAWPFGGGILMIILAIIFWAVSIFISMWGGAALLYAISREDAEIKIIDSFKSSLRLVFPYAWIGILIALAIGLGFILLIIPGLIFGIWFAFAPYIFFKEGIKGVDALKKSKELVKGNWWKVFGRGFVLSLITMLVGIVFGLIPFVGRFVASLFTTPFGIIYFYLMYKDLKTIKQPAQVV